MYFLKFWLGKKGRKKFFSPCFEGRKGKKEIREWGKKYHICFVNEKERGKKLTHFLY